MDQLRGQMGAYRIGDHVARGRSGDTFVAEAADGRTVAIKVHDRVVDGRQEADRLARVGHPGVVGLLDQGTTVDGRTWLVLPWVVGRPLTEVLTTDGPLPIDRARRLITQLAAAVDALHDAGIVHGDLSPNNIMVGPDDHLTVIDLGASSDLRPDGQGGGPTGTVPGRDPDSAADSDPDPNPNPIPEIVTTTGLEVEVTPRYASPEVAEGRRPGPASDRYAVGLIAYEAFTGAFPFPEVATPIAMLGHHAASEPVAPSEHRPNLPASVELALLAALAKDPDARPPTAARLARALARDEAPIGQRRSGATRRRRSLTAAVAATLLVVGAGFGLTLGGDDDGDGDGDGGSDPSAWASGQAAGLSCNRLQAPDFETGPLPEGFYGGDLTNTVTVAAGAGVDGTAAIRVGDTGTYGLFAEIVPVGSAKAFVFSAWLRREGPVETSALYVDYLDADYQQLTAVRDQLPLGQAVGDPDGGRLTLTSEVPAGAFFAVPTVFKDGSSGSLLVDEVVFGPTATCPDLAS